MKNPRLAGRYAKSLLDLSIEKNQLESVYNDIQLFQSICKQNPDFVAMLKSPVINSDKKERIIEAITANKINTITAAFIKLLVNKTREYSLPEIAIAFIEQYNKLNLTRYLIWILSLLQAQRPLHWNSSVTAQIMDTHLKPGVSMFGFLIIETA